jgi:hypothetical protein
MKFNHVRFCQALLAFATKPSRSIFFRSSPFQIFDCFPAFCTLPIDVAAAAKPLLKTVHHLLSQSALDAPALFLSPAAQASLAPRYAARVQAAADKRTKAAAPQQLAHQQAQLRGTWSLLRARLARGIEQLVVKLQQLEQFRHKQRGKGGSGGGGGADGAAAGRSRSRSRSFSFAAAGKGGKGKGDGDEKIDNGGGDKPAARGRGRGHSLHRRLNADDGIVDDDDDDDDDASSSDDDGDIDYGEADADIYDPARMMEVEKDDTDGLGLELGLGLKGLRDSTLSLADIRSCVGQLGEFSGRFLPLLLNLITRAHAGGGAVTAQERRKAAAAPEATVLLECVSAWSSVTPEDAVNSLFKKVLKRILEKEAASNAAAAAAAGVNGGDAALDAERAALVDVAEALAGHPHLAVASLDTLYKVVTPYLGCGGGGAAAAAAAAGGDDDADADGSVALRPPKAAARIHLQKKAYSVLTAVIVSHPTFFEAHWKRIVEDFNAAAVSVHASAARHRLQCLREIVLLVPDLLSHQEILSTLPQLLGEVILAVKEPNRKTRDAAYGVLTALGRQMIVAETADGPLKATEESLADNAHPLLLEFFCMVSGGLAGRTPHMKSAAVLALSRLLYEFKDKVSQDTVSDLLGNVSLLMGEKSREVVKAVLGFVKVACLSLYKGMLHPHLPGLLAGVTAWSDDSKNRFRQKVRVILEIW